MVRLGVVVPCFNEEAVIRETANQLLALLGKLVRDGKIDRDSRIYFVNDGSKDSTWDLIEEMARENTSLVGIKLSRNVGHQNALLAGLLSAEGDALVSIDADLQDDIGVIEQMVDEFAAGSEIVYGVRGRRDLDTAFKRLTAQGYYRLLHLMGVDVIYNHADYRLMGRAAIEALRDFSETNLFLRGLVPLLGFNSSVVEYDRAARFAGESKYSIRQMMALALDGITSFSVVPLRLIMFVGLLVFLFSSVMGIWILMIALFSEKAVPGWGSTALPIYFLGGVQILCIGVLGEYAGKIYKEVKRRPRYVVEKTTCVPPLDVRPQQTTE